MKKYRWNKKVFFENLLTFILLSFTFIGIPIIAAGMEWGFIPLPFN